MLFGSSELHDELIKVDFPEESETTLETYLFEDDDDYDVSSFSSMAQQIAPLPACSIAEIEDVTDFKDKSNI